jgi:hypothetical protein
MIRSASASEDTSGSVSMARRRMPRSHVAAAWAVSYGYSGGVPIEDALPHRLFEDLGQVAQHVRSLRSTTVFTLLETTT